MNDVRDNDLELLESYLDEELSPEQAEAMEQRLEAEPALTAALEHLRIERGVRRDFWQAMEGDGAEELTRSLIGQIRRHRHRRMVWRMLRPLAAVAAAVLLFVGGWMGRAWIATPIFSRAHDDGEVQAVMVYQVTLKDEWGNAVVQKFESLDQARQFVADLHRWQERQQQMQNGQVVVVADRF